MGNNRVLPLIRFRGQVRPLLLAGTKSYVEKCLKEAEPYFPSLRERGVSGARHGEAVGMWAGMVRGRQMLRCAIGAWEVARAGKRGCLGTWGCYRVQQMWPDPSMTTTTSACNKLPGFPCNMRSTVCRSPPCRCVAMFCAVVPLIVAGGKAADDPEAKLRALKKEFRKESG